MGAESDFEAAAGRLREYEVIDWLVVVMGTSVTDYIRGSRCPIKYTGFIHTAVNP